MKVTVRTVRQASTVVANATAVGLDATQVLVTDARTGGLKPSRIVEFPTEQELSPVVRSVVEPVTVLYTATDDAGQDLTTSWQITAAKFEVEWPDDPAQVSLIRSHFGARRFAHNWAVGQVKTDLDARQADPDHVPVPWTLAALRKQFNQVKDEVAPWWADNSKECYSSGINDAVVALGNWQASKNGTRKGRTAGFPKFKSKHSDRNRVRFTTGTMRLSDDRRTVTLPVIGNLRSKENTRRVHRYTSTGRARVLSMTLSERWGRLFVAVSYVVYQPHLAPAPTKPDAVVGVDLGMRSLATWSDTDGTRASIDPPKPLLSTLAERRRVSRKMSRRIVGSRGHRAAKATLQRLDRTAVNLRRDTAHQLTRALVGTYGTIVVENLDHAAMARTLRRSFRRSRADVSMGLIRPMLTYKTAVAGTTLVVADRWYASSQIHHGCGCRLIAPDGRKMAKMLVCCRDSTYVDRDLNAADNLRDWPGHASRGRVAAPDLLVSNPGGGVGDESTDTTPVVSVEPMSDCPKAAVGSESRTEQH